MKTVFYIGMIAIGVFLLNKTTVFFTSLTEPNLIHKNTNIAFSIPLPYLLIMILIPTIIMGGIYLAYRLLDFSRKSTVLAIGLAIGGALSNAIDRIVHGAVLDYIDVKFWPVFNIADIAITVGILLVIFFYDKMKKTCNARGSSRPPAPYNRGRRPPTRHSPQANTGAINKVAKRHH